MNQDRLPRELDEFYSTIAEIDLPDFHVGYYVHPISMILESVPRSLPVRIESDEIRSDIVTFASDGGGGLFALDVTTGVVHYLPTGEIVDGVYRGGMERVRVVAPNLQDFLNELLFRAVEFAATGNWRGSDW